MSLTSIQKLLLGGHSIGTPGPIYSDPMVELPQNFPKIKVKLIKASDIRLPIANVDDIIEKPIKGF